MTRLEGRASVVTGAGGLLGAAFCRALAEHGASVLVNDIDAERAAAARGFSGSLDAAGHDSDVSARSCKLHRTAAPHPLARARYHHHFAL